MSKTIAVFTGTRAEYGLLQNIMGRLKESSQCELFLIVGGMHFSKEHGNTWQEILKDGFSIDAKIDMLPSSDTYRAAARSAGEGMSAVADILDATNPDLIVLLGDRYEALAVAQAAAIMLIPIAHIHGGEISEGAIDDSIRHAITKLSTLHFTASEQYRSRVIQMGEHPDRVFNVGAPGTENLKDKYQLLSLNKLPKMPIDIQKPFILCTYHSATAVRESAEVTTTNMLMALLKQTNHKILTTYPNIDPDSNKDRKSNV